MTFQGVFVVLILVAAALFAMLNQPLLYAPQTVRIAGGTFSVPLVGLLLAVTAGAVLLMLLADALALSGWRESNRRLRRRLDDRDHEVAVMKSDDYEIVSAKLDAMRHDLSDQIASLGRLIETRPVETRPVETRPVMREERAGIAPPR